MDEPRRTALLAAAIRESLAVPGAAPRPTGVHVARPDPEDMPGHTCLARGANDEPAGGRP